MSDQLLVATRKGLFTVDRGAGGQWSIARVDFLGDNVSMVLPVPGSRAVLAALELGHYGVKLHRSEDGVRWEECSAPAYPEKPEGVEDQDSWGKPIPWSTVKIWALESAGAPSRTLWCGTIPGGLFRSRDDGGSWELMRSLWDHPKRKEWMGGGADLPGIHSVCVHPQDPRRVWVGVSLGGVWMTADEGDTWECRAEGMWAAYMPPEKKYDPNAQDPHRVVQCAGAPDHLWAQHHNGIFRSTDGARSWQEVNAPRTTFGFAVAVHPADSNVAWFIPAASDERRVPVSGQVYVSRTRDGGKSFDLLDAGLPQQHAYDITYRHGLDVDDSGQRLAFGTTTGSLWLSEDQGDTWQCVSNHLPPVYCLRFVK